MISKHIFPQNELPEKWHFQILSFLRIVWAEGFMNENLYRDWITKPSDNPVSIIYTHNDLLISHSQVVNREIVYQGINYVFYGLTGVFTFPTFRNLGYGKKVVLEGMKYIDQQSNKDILLLSCEQQNVGFYEKCGWEFNDIPLLEGDEHSPNLTEARISMQFVSEKAKLNQKRFVDLPLYFDDEIW